MLPNIRTCPTTKNGPPPDVNSAEAEKPCSEGKRKAESVHSGLPSTGDKEHLQTSGPASHLKLGV